MGKSSNHSHMSKYRWDEDKVIKKDSCFECGGYQDIHYHHVVPEVKGGTMTLPLCIICHGKVHNRDFLRIKELQRVGIEKAKLKGVYRGRNSGTKEDPYVFLKKPKNQQIIQYLSSGYTQAEIIKILKCSYGTINKVKKLTYKPKQPVTKQELPPTKVNFWKKIFKIST